MKVPYCGTTILEVKSGLRIELDLEFLKKYAAYSITLRLCQSSIANQAGGFFSPDAREVRRD